MTHSELVLMTDVFWVVFGGCLLAIAAYDFALLGLKWFVVALSRLLGVKGGSHD